MPLGDWFYSSTFDIDNPELCRDGYRVTFFEEDDITPILGSVDAEGNITEGTFHTSPSCPRPYMKWPEEISSTKIEFADGKTKIGAMTISLVDIRRIASDQYSGIITSLINDLPDARVVIERWHNDQWNVVLHGVARNVRQTSKIVSFDITVNDIWDRSIEVPLFTINETWSVFPEGPIEPYGVVNGTPLVPAADVYPGALSGSPANFVEFIDKYDAAFTDPSRRAGYIVIDAWSEPNANQNIPPQAVEIGELGVIARVNEENIMGFPGVTVRWRPVGGTDLDWVYLRNMRARTNPDGSHRGNWWLSYNNFNQFSMYMEGPTEDLPVHLEDIEVQVLSRGAPTPNQPLMWEGPYGTLLKKIINGDFTEEDDPLGIPWEQARLDELEALLPLARLKLDKPEDDARKFIEEEIFKINGLAPAFNIAGKIEPVAYTEPYSSVGLPILTDANTKITSDWEIDVDSSVREVEFVYPRDFVAPPYEAFPLGTFIHRTFNVPPTIVQDYAIYSREIKHTGKNAGAKRGKTIKFKPKTVRAVGTYEAESVYGIEEPEQLIAIARINQLLSRFRNAPKVTIEGMVTDPAVQAMAAGGKWGVLQSSYLPDPFTGLRGCNRLVQVISISPAADVEFVEMELLDGGPNLPVLSEFATFGAPYVTGGDYVASVDVLSLPADTKAVGEWSYDINGAPSGFWYPTTGPALSVPWALWKRFQSGVTVWMRTRTERDGFFPQPWIVQGPITTSLVPKIDLGGVETLNELATAHVETTDAASIRMEWQVHDDVEGGFTGVYDGTIEGPVDVNGDFDSADFAAVPYGKRITVVYTAFFGWTGTEVSGISGLPMQVSQLSGSEL